MWFFHEAAIKDLATRNHLLFCNSLFWVAPQILNVFENPNFFFLIITGPSGLRSITRNELYDIIKRENEPTFDGKLRFMESEILKQHANNYIILKDVRHRLSI